MMNLQYSGTSRYEFHLFRDGVRKVIYSYAEARFTCKWLNPFPSPKPSLIKCEYYTPQAKIRHCKHKFNDTHLNNEILIKINKTTITMPVVVMNNDNFVATHPRTVV